MSKLNFNCMKHQNKEYELKILNFLENKFSKIDKKLEEQIFGILKNKQIKEINSLNYGIETLKNNYIIEKKKIDELLLIKTNINKYLELNEEKYREEVEKKVNPNYLCNICFENRCNIVLNPCGHMYCQNCFNKENKICHMCRKPVKDIIKIYIN